MVRVGGRDVTSAPPAVRDVAFVFQQYSLYPHLSVYDNLAFRLRSPARHARGRGRRAGARDRADAPHRGQAGQPGHPALRRPDAARGDRARPRAPPVDLPHGRAALLAGRQAARRAAGRAQADPARAGRDDPVRHPRSDRGDDDGHAHRRDRPGPPGPAGQPARDLREPGQQPRGGPAGDPHGQPGAARAVPAPPGPGRDGDHRGPHRARAHPQERERLGGGPGPADRAPGRSESPARGGGRHRRGDIGGAGDRLHSG
jgi:ABC-type sugar transport system ATPase subunit